MNVLVTGGSGFIGRWVVKRLLDDNNQVWVLDDLSNGRAENLDEFRANPDIDVTIGDIKDTAILSRLFRNNFDICIHLAASIVV
ncbi:MAG: GDP-mannose 4,6-dehydratase, partial [ANME-2 cluster archaeon]|nr:GDP-mannose 4,6-dehydratase [ANME-2 cluster archaeon]